MIEPVFRSTAKVISSFGLVGPMAVRKMRLFQTTGDEWPGGTAHFHKTFVSGPK